MPYWSSISLKARSDNGSVSDDGRAVSSPVFTSMPLIGRTVERRRQIVDNRVEQRLNALVLEGRTAQNREEGAVTTALRSSFLMVSLEISLPFR